MATDVEAVVYLMLVRWPGAWRRAVHDLGAMVQHPSTAAILGGLLAAQANAAVVHPA